jgi:hemerythrin-like domain-containing protein
MTVLDAFQRQHTQILRIANEIGDLLKEAATPEGATRHRALLSTLSGTLNVHLAMEDGSLYPRLARDEDPEVRAIAAKFEREMQGLSKSFRSHLDRWASARAIRERPSEFAGETKRIIDALSRRIAFEDAELYPTLARLDG